MDLNTEELLKLERFKTANLSKKLAEARNTIDEYEAKMFYYESKLLSLRNVLNYRVLQEIWHTVYAIGILIPSC